MAYWWVSQNKTYRHERGGGYLWAPARDKSGHTPQHWRTMLDVQPGDLIFSYVGQHIRSLAVAGSSARPDIRPSEFSDQSLWKQEGYRIDVSYEDFHPPIDIPPIAADLARLLPTRHSPLTRRGTGVQGYLFNLPRPAGRFLLDRAGQTDEGADEDAGERLASSALGGSNVPDTEKRALIKSRVGQGRFRADLLRLWEGRCAVSGLGLVALLRASHIKPWSDSNNQERLDPYNGLLLSPAYDAAFDAGLITFSDDGAVVVSPTLTGDQAGRAGIDPRARLRKVDEPHLPYFRHHQAFVFQSGG